MMEMVKNVVGTPPPCRVLSKAARAHACKRKDRGERVTNENVHGCRFQAGPGPDGLGRRPGERDACLRDLARFAIGYCGPAIRRLTSDRMLKAIQKLDVLINDGSAHFAAGCRDGQKRRKHES